MLSQFYIFGVKCLITFHGSNPVRSKPGYNSGTVTAAAARLFPDKFRGQLRKFVAQPRPLSCPEQETGERERVGGRGTCIMLMF